MISNDKIFVYVGRWEHIPAGRRRTCALFAQAHPRDFPALAQQVQETFWSNNADVVREFPAEQVICCNAHGQRRLCEHPDWEKWKDEFDAGEFWSLVGDDWIPEQKDEKSE